jgi:hypothetical protein
MKIVNGLRAEILVLLAACVIPANAQQYCNSQMLSGEYTFVINGMILAGPLAGLVNGVAVQTFDGNGSFTSKDHVVLNGVQPAEEWRQSTGTYTVNPDCTGKQQVNFPNNQPPPRISYFIITNSGKQLNFVSGNSGVALSGVATKR